VDRTGGGNQVAANQLAARTAVVLADGGRSTCRLVAFPSVGSQAARLVISLDEPPAPPEAYQVLAEPADGNTPVVIGTIAMVNGHGMLVTSLPARIGPVDGVRIMDSPNTIKYHASFAPI
jgi:hypothetical protein